MRKSKKLDWLGPDGKSQVSVVYEDHLPKRVDTIVLSTQHTNDVGISQVREEIIRTVIEPISSLIGSILPHDFWLILRADL